MTWDSCLVVQVWTIILGLMVSLMGSSMQRRSSTDTQLLMQWCFEHKETVLETSCSCSEVLHWRGSVEVICKVDGVTSFTTFWSVCERAPTHNKFDYMFVPQNSMQIAWYFWNSTSHFLRFLWPLCSLLSRCQDARRLLDVCKRCGPADQSLWVQAFCVVKWRTEIFNVCVCLVYRHPKNTSFRNSRGQWLREQKEKDSDISHSYAIFGLTMSCNLAAFLH